MTRPRILVVDDHPDVLGYVSAVLEREGYAVTSTSTLDSAVVVMSGSADIDTAVTAMRSGAHDFLVKPFTPAQLCTAMADVLRRRDDRKRHAEGRRMLEGLVQLRTSELTEALSRLEYSYDLTIEALGAALIETHPEMGYRILSGISFLENAAAVVRCHHERYDGTGYPLGLSGGDIPLVARIFSVADVVDVLMNGRVYQAAVSEEAVRREIAACSGSQFDPEVVRAFMNVHLTTMEVVV
jgi:response regulator RpfG family c-di-GMP phosphodiesterase